ncbi:hypothetical protein PIROE2DRAFT_6579 [Piromyces sp. E2]|nr:hypothetical protein PIROE2DRAFT_6579 [Piromyces sp. E2]|eukprot:OUM66241.1 hypothetical protein PIROE2DRAFT_6579 [Piromyces sp. E2]
MERTCKYQTKVGAFSDIPFLVSVNADIAVIQSSRARATNEDHNFQYLLKCTKTHRSIEIEFFLIELEKIDKDLNKSLIECAKFYDDQIFKLIINYASNKGIILNLKNPLVGCIKVHDDQIIKLIINY